MTTRWLVIILSYLSHQIPEIMLLEVLKIFFVFVFAVHILKTATSSSPLSTSHFFLDNLNTIDCKDRQPFCLNWNCQILDPASRNTSLNAALREDIQRKDSALSSLRWLCGPSRRTLDVHGIIIFCWFGGALIVGESMVIKNDLTIFSYTQWMPSWCSKTNIPNSHWFFVFSQHTK